jgi:hypothetical protein
MKILYIAKHGPNDNEDEDAISHCLRTLGHEAICISQDIASQSLHALPQADFMLFHTWGDVQAITRISTPKAFWNFDMTANRDDGSLQNRMMYRRAWNDIILPHCICAFYTDGDWVDQDTTGKLYHLMQGADERKIGLGHIKFYNQPPLLFMGMVNHGQKRRAHIQHLSQRWGNQLEIFGNNGRRKHGKELADIIAGAKIVIAPNGPNTDRYCSNRIFLTIGFQGFLLHPYCKFLESYYTDREEVVYYRSVEECDELIQYYLDRPEERYRIAEAGFNRTVKEHLYRHRVTKLMEIVKERL